MKQQITRLIDDEGAVSPVIGVILMVAITVILAAVIGTFVLGLGGQVSQTAPQASISVQNVDIPSAAAGDTDTIELRHGGSDTIHTEETTIQVSQGGTNIAVLEDTAPNEVDFETADTVTIEINSAGDKATVNGNAAWTDTGVGSTTLSQSAGTVSITFIDDPSGQIIADKSVTP